MPLGNKLLALAAAAADPGVAARYPAMIGEFVVIVSGMAIVPRAEAVSALVLC
jgi:hypothetical protein